MVGSLLILLLGLFACSGPVARQPTEGSPQRVVSLLPSATELIFAVDKGEVLVGVTSNDSYPPEVLELPKVGDQTVDLEKVLSLKPDLVVLDANFNQDRQRLERLGIEVLELRCARVGDIAPAMRLLGERLGNEEGGAVAAAAFENSLSKIEPLSIDGTVFVEVWGEPLMTAGSKTLFSDVLTLLRVENCYADQSGYFQVDPEDLVSRSPSFVLLPTSPGTESRSKAAELCGRVGVNPTVVKIEADLLVRAGPRLVKGIEQLRKSLSNF